MALIGAFRSLQSRATCPGLSHRKHLRSLTSTRGCLHSLAVCPLRLQLLQVISVLERGVVRQSGQQGLSEPELQDVAQHVEALPGRV